ncbi:MAG: RDD family protein [Sulfurimonas sp.]|uniref:RDD family protein n=1 Tax=Sulfurimonas sp. TaxID=2022749 RepID=UPI00262E88E4|nr:RDD family protein [Sulfurimonas sp.]MCW8895552.1 RDD family protein [Sulfurimonas sp.]MCW8954714.1 RDD family protein [Sulfurimonas sp.]
MRFRKLKKQNKTTPTINKPKYMHARYSYRIKAFITDMFMIYAPILYIIAYVVMSGKDDFQSSELAPLIAVSIYGLIYALLLSNFGHTPGKRAYDMKVVDDRTGETISFFRALLRFLAFLFTATTLLGLFLPFYRKDNKALHDLICKTLVVVEKKA